MKTKERSEQPTVTEVVEGMHRYFRDNGYFEPEDVRRVFGDESKVIEVEVSSDSWSSARVKR